MAAELRRGVINVVELVILAGFLLTICQATSVESDQNKPDKLADDSKIGYVKEKAGNGEKAVEGSVESDQNKPDKLADDSKIGYVKEKAGNAEKESDQNKPDKLADDSKIGYVKEKAGNAEKAVEGAGTASWDSVKTWANVASDKLPKSFSFKNTEEPASHDSKGTTETVKETATKGYEIGKKATLDVIDNAGQAAQKIGEKIKQTAGEL